MFAVIHLEVARLTFAVIVLSGRRYNSLAALMTGADGKEQYQVKYGNIELNGEEGRLQGMNRVLDEAESADGKVTTKGEKRRKAGVRQSKRIPGETTKESAAIIETAPGTQQIRHFVSWDLGTCRDALASTSATETRTKLPNQFHCISNNNKLRFIQHSIIIITTSFLTIQLITPNFIDSVICRPKRTNQQRHTRMGHTK